MSGAVLSEHQAEVATTADATALAERGHDATPYGTNERRTDEPEQLDCGERASEEHRQFNSGFAAAATTNTTAGWLSSAYCSCPARSH